MKTLLLPCGLVLCAAINLASSQNVHYPPNARPHIPGSSVENWYDVGLNFHTNHLLLVTDAKPEASGTTSPAGETPQTIRPVYELPSTGGSGVIAIVDAYNYPTALQDFNAFSKQFGLPVETSTNVTSNSNSVFQVVYASGSKPAGNGGWNQEEALDIEWAHAMAPKAKIVLVEAASSSTSALLNAIVVAGDIAGVKEVSMSWGGSEFSGESYYDAFFTHPGVIYIASSGDVGSTVNWPGVSINVISAGGTTIHRNSSGVFESETGWSDGGGGQSQYELRPSYQNGISSIVGKYRGVPDFSFDADPNSGVAVYDSTAYEGYSGWMVFGGTSVSSPSLAGVINLADSGSNSSETELTLIYKNLGTTNFRDIVSGSNGRYTAKAGWDFVTGVGTNLGLNGK